MSLIANKAEKAAVIDLMNSPHDPRGNPWTEDSMAKAVVDLVSSMREERLHYALVLELSPKVYHGYGPFATKDAAFDSVDKNPMAYIASRAAIVPIIGHKHAKAQMEAKANEPPAPRFDEEVRKDLLAFRRGFRGKAVDRDRFLAGSS